MKFKASDLSIQQLSVAFSEQVERPLAVHGECRVYFTEITTLGYTSALLVGSKDTVFLGAPAGLFDAANPAQECEVRSQWIRRFIDSKATKRKFVSVLSAADISMERLPYGSLAYLAHDFTYQERWSKSRAPLWSGWYRTYVFPTTPSAKKVFIAKLAEWFDAATPFGTRSVLDSTISAKNSDQVSARTLRDRALFSAELDSSQPRIYRQEYEQILSTLKQEIEKAEVGQAITTNELSDNFQEAGCRLRLNDSVVKDERRRLIEAIGKYRARLLRILRWPIFVGIATAEIMRSEIVDCLPAYGFEPAPYDGIEELKAYLVDMRSTYPAFFKDPFEDLYLL